MAVMGGWGAAPGVRGCSVPPSNYTLGLIGMAYVKRIHVEHWNLDIVSLQGQVVHTQCKATKWITQA